MFQQTQYIEICNNQFSSVKRDIDSTVEEIRKNKDAAMSVAIGFFDQIQVELNRRRSEVIDEIEKEFIKKANELMQQQRDVAKSIDDVKMSLKILKELYADSSNDVNIRGDSSPVNHVRS